MRTDVKECRDFLRTVCVVSATMASMSFVGLVFILSNWGGIRPISVILGIITVYLFGSVSVVSIFALRPKTALSKRDLTKPYNFLLLLFLTSWIYFLTVVLIIAIDIARVQIL